jgi:hypothetical protein
MPELVVFTRKKLEKSFFKEKSRGAGKKKHFSRKNHAEPERKTIF